MKGASIALTFSPMQGYSEKGGSRNALNHKQRAVLRDLKHRRENVTLFQKIKNAIFLFSVIPLFCILLVSIPIFVQQKQEDLEGQIRKETAELVSDMNYNMSMVETLSKAALTNNYLASEVSRVVLNENVSDYEKYRFKTQTLSSLSIIVSVNQIKAARIHIEKPDIQEYPSQIYRMDRASTASWYAERDQIPYEGKWYMNVTPHPSSDVYSSYYCANNMASYVVPFKTGSQYSSNFEILLPMSEIIPNLYEVSASEDTIMIDENGTIYGVNPDSVFGKVTVDELLEYLQLHSFDDYEANGVSTISIWHSSGPAVIAVSKSVTRGLVYIRMISISGEMMSALSEIGVFVLIFAAVMMVVLAAINRIVRRLLADLKVFRSCVQEVGQGNLDVEIPHLRQVEINEIALEYNQMLGSIKRLTVEAIRREVVIKEAQIKALEKQIDSHFLYNVLDSIKMMAEIEGMHNISGALLALAKMFRYNLQTREHDVTLREEMEYLENYIRLCNIRFDYYISLSKNVDSAVEELRVPKMILQPIVENSIEHGLDELAEDTAIYLKAYVKDGKAFVEVSDMGKGMNEETLERVRNSIEKGAADDEPPQPSPVRRKGNGIGLHNIHERIRLMYGAQYGVKIYSQLYQYTKVTLTLPAHQDTDASAKNKTESLPERSEP